MKKNILIAAIFIAIFLTGKLSVYADECDKKGYDNKCIYANYDIIDSIDLYYNSNETLITHCQFGPCRDYYNKNDVAEEAYGYNEDNRQYDYNLIYNNEIKASETVNGCPSAIYYTTWSDVTFFGRKSYYTYSINYLDESNRVETHHRYQLRTNCNELGSEENEEDPVVIDDCKKLLSDELIDIINSIMNVIKIGVPILLIGLLIFDFATAIFAGSDDKVNKAKSKAIKRVIIAIVIFFVPTLINFVFDIVNYVWGENFGTCVIEENNN